MTSCEQWEEKKSEGQEALHTRLLRFRHLLLLLLLFLRIPVLRVQLFLVFPSLSLPRAPSCDLPTHTLSSPRAKKQRKNLTAHTHSELRRRRRLSSKPRVVCVDVTSPLPPCMRVVVRLRASRRLSPSFRPRCAQRTLRVWHARVKSTLASGSLRVGWRQHRRGTPAEPPQRVGSLTTDRRRRRRGGEDIFTILLQLFFSQEVLCTNDSL